MSVGYLDIKYIHTWINMYVDTYGHACIHRLIHVHVYTYTCVRCPSVSTGVYTFDKCLDRCLEVAQVSGPSEPSVNLVYGVTLDVSRCQMSIWMNDESVY